MATSRPTLSSLIARIESSFASRIAGADSPLRRSVLKVLAKVISGVSHLVYGRLAWLEKQIFADTADSDNLKRHGTLYNVNAKAAEKATGTATATGTNGTDIPALTVLRNSAGEEFETDALVTISGGVATLALTAKVAGIDGNTATGSTLTMISPIPSIDTTATVDTPGITGGIDLELEPPHRARLITRIQQPPHGGTANDYEKWALENSGVTRAFYYSQPAGLGTVGISFVMDDKTTYPDFVTNGSFTDGTDLVSNGDFDVDSEWTKGTGWTISGGTASCDGSQASASELREILQAFVPNRIYKITYTLSGVTAGTIKPRLGTTGTYGTTRSTNGTFSDEIVVPEDKPNQIIFEADASFVGSIDGVIVVDRASTDWQQGDGWAITGGIALCDGSQTAVSNLDQNLVQFTVGRTYKVTFTISSVTAGGIKPIMGFGGTSGTTRTVNGTYVENLVAAGTNRIILEATSAFVGNVDNVLVEDEISKIIPGQSELKTVSDYIENDRRPVNAEVFATAMDAVEIDFTIELKTVDTAAIRTAVETNLADLITREADRSGTILLSHIREAISTATDEVDHTLTVPSADEVASAGQIHIMGTVTWV